eukprot:CAMPEP_0201912394 /NCGR_PEP_ID=MMETSP0903-20130614/3077_1 /ASSEMBLY_ACC=CAM_ASM_000552 /TAXON_ID=420261 /ORGANISM="Thalassiosira antarctica, Strain CCMP982" /LENGTH=298 /DNA_ID=CAMNT_0048447345 /DNA_START=91 /DNA_END=987 /DNA_ORIENTATION=-
MASYGKKTYWNERYARETESVDWIITGYSLFQHLLTPKFLANTKAPAPGGEIVVRRLNTPAPQCPPLTEGNDGDEARQNASPTNMGVVEFPSKEKCRVLHVGCGNSQLAEHMLHGGFTNIVNVDYSEVVIKKMQEKYDENFADLQSCIERENLLRNSLGLESRDDNNLNASKSVTPKMTFEVADITEGMHSYPDESFDLIICKKTLDVILCGAGSVANARSMMTECFRLLNKDHGVMMIFSSAKPEDRAVFFENDAWSGVENIKLPNKEDGLQFRKGKKNSGYVYILHKQSWRTQVGV